MKYKHSHNVPSSTTTTIQRFIVVVTVFSILFLQSRNTAYALTAIEAAAKAKAAAASAATNAMTSAVTSRMPASSGIAGKCLGQVAEQQVTAYAAGAVIAAIGATGQATSAFLGVPSSDLGSGTGSTLQSGEGGATTVMSWIKPMTDCMIHEASQLMMDNLNMMVANAINQGLNGSPNYNTNTNQFMSSLSNMVSGQLRKQIDGITLCDFTGNDSFKQGLINNIGNSTRQTNSSAQNFEQKIKCPFPQAKAKEFYNDFNKGGWSSFEASLSDNGNPFGTSLIASQELAVRQEETARLAKEQLDRGNGYYPVVDGSTCEYPEGLEAFLDAEGDETDLANAQRLYCKVITPGKTVADSASKVATSAWDQLNISGAMGKTMDGFSTAAVKDAMDGNFYTSPTAGATGQ